MLTPMQPCAAFQHEIGACAIDDDPNDEYKAIFPKSKLAALCTYETISSVLNCMCSTCDEQRCSLNIVLPVHTATGMILGDRRIPACVITFCLLGYIGCPQLVLCCLEHDTLANDISVGNFLDSLVPDYMRMKVWNEFDSTDPARSLRFAKLFSWHKRQFFLPIIDDRSFVEYSKSVRLPFIDEQPLFAQSENGDLVQEHGAFGRVFSFRILPEYDHLSPIPGSLYVRKELFGTSSAKFHAERTNLQLVKELQDPHLVRLAKAYKHGDTFNFIFPRSKTNLSIYLRNEYYSTPSIRSTHIEANPLWNQALGIANALSNVVNYTPADNSERLYGYHFDIKPANILVEDDGTFLISDFGQARFQAVGETSRITPVGGTEAYAPPEIETAARYNRKYDVWSLGCIFLEILTFVMKGHDGVKLLDRSRLMSDGNIAEDRFFRYCNVKRCHELKPTIFQWIKDLRESEYIQSWQSKEFLQELSDLILAMLQPVILQRLSCHEVCQILEGIIKRFQADAMSILPQEVVVQGDDVEYAPQITHKIHSMLYNSTGFWIPGSLAIVEDCHHDLHILAKKDNESAVARMKIGPRSQTKIVPRYTSHSRAHEGYTDCHLYFSIIKPGAVDFAATKLYFTKSADLLLGLSAFIGQDIASSLPVNACFIKRKMSRIRRISRQDANIQSEAAKTVELWSENPRLHPVARSGSGHRRSVRQNPFCEPTHRRVVIYFSTSIVIIRFAKNVRLERRESASNSKSIKLIPTDPKRDPTFPASVIKPTKGELLPSVPVSSTFLEKEEDEQKFECTSAEIHFATEDDRNVFYNTYRKLKEEWRAEDKEFERFRREMGHTLGWAPE